MPTRLTYFAWIIKMAVLASVFGYSIKVALILLNVVQMQQITASFHFAQLKCASLELEHSVLDIHAVDFMLSFIYL